MVLLCACTVLRPYMQTLHCCQQNQLLFSGFLCRGITGCAPTESLCQSQLYMYAVEFLLPLMKGECQNVKNFSCSPTDSIACSVRQKVAILLFIFSLSLSLTARSINDFSAEFLEGFLPLPHFLKSLHMERDTHKLFRDKNLIYLCFIVPGMATDWFGNLLFQL